MENATEALVMAGSIFLLIIALTLSISSFSRVKTQIDELVSSKEKIEYAVDLDNSLHNFMRSKGKKYTRTVSIETIVTTLRRIRKENFDVYIIFKNPNNVDDFAEALRQTLNQSMTFEDINVTASGKVLKFSISGAANRYVEDKISDNFDKTINMLYNKVGDKKFKEYYGIYKGATEGVSDVEKSERKIITYVELN